MKKNEEVPSDMIEITPATMTVVNQRLLVQAFTAKDIKDPETGLWSKAFVLVNEKTGKITDIPRFFVAKTAKDLPLSDPETGAIVKGSLPTATEVFPFIPPADDFQFPEVFDPGSMKKYTMLEWMELTGYILPDTTGAVSK